MIIIHPRHDFLHLPLASQALGLIEAAGRTCYKSEDKMTADSAARFARNAIKSGHHSIIEHVTVTVTVRFTCDRGVSHELVRHRLAAYSQESTRYVNYGHAGEIVVIRPPFWREDSEQYALWYAAMGIAENIYMRMIEAGVKPEEARSVLPNSLKTEIVMTANIREWRHVLKLRTSPAAHPQIRELMLPLLKDLAEWCPPLFDDLLNKEE